MVEKERKTVLKGKLFDFEHEKDLEKEMNAFLKEITEKQLIDIKFDVSVTSEDEENQVFCFSSMIIYRT